MGAGSTVFAKNILGDCMCSIPLCDAHLALYDTDGDRLRQSHMMLDNLNNHINAGQAKITAHLGVNNRRSALKNAKYVINAIQVGGYRPGTVIDFEIPRKYGLRQTIADTLGIGGIFRALRTIPVCLAFARDMEAVCPEAWFLNYVNPMAMVSGAMLIGSNIRTVGLCHSVQVCAIDLLRRLGIADDVKHLQWKIAGINHQAWLLEIYDGSKDLYPQIRKRAARSNEAAIKHGAPKHDDMVRFEFMRHFGYYITESSEHSAEYMPYWIKAQFPQLVQQFNIPLDEYPRRCVKHIEDWNQQSEQLVHNTKLSHQRSGEYGSYLMEAMETDVPYRIGGNVLNNGLITNLPRRAIVEVTCLVDRNGVQPTYVGDLPEQLAAINRTNINVQLLVLEAALYGSRDAVYHAAMLDPHTASELTLDQIRELCDEMIEVHGLNGMFQCIGHRSVCSPNKSTTRAQKNKKHLQ